MWALYTAIGIMVVILYFTARVEWVYRKYYNLIREGNLDTYKTQYPSWERALYRYFYIWRFASLKGKK